MRRDGKPRYDAVLALGDDQYTCGGLSAYRRSYRPTWGRVASATYPVVGDKDYRTTANAPGATGCTDPPGRAHGFFRYFTGVVPAPAPGYRPPASDATGAGGYYGFEIPRGCTPGGGRVCWHVIALNGNCRKAPGCSRGTAEYGWLRRDLARRPNGMYPCTIAFWHWPTFSSGSHNVGFRHGRDPEYVEWWRLLDRAGVDVVLAAHDHDYERFAPQDARGRFARDGIREWVVGTGGASHVRFPSSRRLPLSRASDDRTFGVLALRLHPTSYAWRFVPERRHGFTDASRSSVRCR
jgi:hypothetical protein